MHSIVAHSYDISAIAYEALRTESLNHHRGNALLQMILSSEPLSIKTDWGVCCAWRERAVDDGLLIPFIPENSPYFGAGKSTPDGPETWGQGKKEPAVQAARSSAQSEQVAELHTVASVSKRGKLFVAGTRSWTRKVSPDITDSALGRPTDWFRVFELPATSHFLHFPFTFAFSAPRHRRLPALPSDLRQVLGRHILREN